MGFVEEAEEASAKAEEASAKAEEALVIEAVGVDRVAASAATEAVAEDEVVLAPEEVRCHLFMTYL